jgi:hypothetical protein
LKSWPKTEDFNHCKLHLSNTLGFSVDTARQDRFVEQSEGSGNSIRVRRVSIEAKIGGSIISWALYLDTVKAYPRSPGTAITP